MSMLLKWSIVVAARSKAWVFDGFFWYCGFESRRRHAWLSLVSALCCQVEISAKGRSLVQRSPTECVCVSDREASIMRRSWPTRACCAMGEKVIELEMENSELFTKCRGFRILARNFTSSFWSWVHLKLCHFFYCHIGWNSGTGWFPMRRIFDTLFPSRLEYNAALHPSYCIIWINSKFYMHTHTHTQYINM